MGKCLSQTLSRRQNEIQLWEAMRGTLTWYGEVGQRLRQKKITVLIICWWEVITRKLQMDSSHKTLHCLFGLKRTVILYNEKLSQAAKYWILCVWYCLSVKQNKCQTEIVGLGTAAPHSSLFQHFMRWKKHFLSVWCAALQQVSHAEFAASCADYQRKKQHKEVTVLWNTWMPVDLLSNRIHSMTKLTETWQ